MSEALETYLRLKKGGKTSLFETTANRSVDYLIAAIGDKTIASYTTPEAGQFRDALFARGLSSSSVKRIFSVIKAIVHLSITENGLACQNAFRGIYMPERNDVRKRKPIPIDVIRDIQRECREIDDDIRWLIALISDTGMRLAEAAGLLVADLKLDDEIPHVVIQPHEWRPLKTTSSHREIPLVGASLWACGRIVANVEGPYAFPRYASARGTNSNHASAGLNKWLKPRAPEGCVVHSFRHSLRDRLRAIQCPADIVDTIGGWSTNGIGQQYGNGYNLDITEKWMRKLLA